MSRFHINDKGQPGKCSANDGRCPFGGEHQHYASEAKARAAYELSMASELIPASSKAEGRKPFDTTGAKRSYPDIGSTVTIARGAEIWDNKNGRFVGKTGKVVAFNGTTYTIATEDGDVAHVNHAFVKTVATPNLQETSGWPALGSTYDTSLNRKTWAQLEAEDEELKNSYLSSDEKLERRAAVVRAKNTFYQRKYGFTEKELFFDREKEAQKLKDVTNWANNDPAALEKRLDELALHWETQARTEPAKSHEDNVPIRLIPTGSEVYYAYSKGSPWHKVGMPVDNGPTWDEATNAPTGPHDIVGRWWDGQQWDYVSADTTFKTGYVPAGKPVAKKWENVNKRAARLKEMREQARKDRSAEKISNTRVI